MKCLVITDTESVGHKSLHQSSSFRWVDDEQSGETSPMVGQIVVIIFVKDKQNPDGGCCRGFCCFPQIYVLRKLRKVRKVRKRDFGRRFIEAMD